MNSETQTQTKKCEDCKRETNMKCVPACPDHLFAGSLCCSKNICSDFCVFKCPNGHENQLQSNEGWLTQHECSVCQVKFSPTFEWSGISPAEWHKRYD